MLYHQSSLYKRPTGYPVPLFQPSGNLIEGESNEKIMFTYRAGRKCGDWRKKILFKNGVKYLLNRVIRL
jgi:hypothetical protein